MNINQFKKIYLRQSTKFNWKSTCLVKLMSFKISLTLAKYSLRFMMILTIAFPAKKYVRTHSFRFLNSFNINFAPFLRMYAASKYILFKEIKLLKILLLAIALNFSLIKPVITFWDFLMIFKMVNFIMYRFKIMHSWQHGIRKLIQVNLRVWQIKIYHKLKTW
jgi:hypothetical protein